MHTGRANSPKPSRAVVGEWPVALFLLGLLPGFYQALHPFQGLGLGPGREMVAIARSLIDHGTFGDPFQSMRTGPTAVNPSLYPLFLALCMKLLGSPIAIVRVVMLANILANAFAAALLPRISMLLWGTSAPGILGGTLMILASRLQPDWDTSYTQVGLILFFLVTWKLLRRDGPVALQGAAAGAMAGVLFLLSQVVALVAVPWIAFLLFARRTRLRDAVRFSLSLLLAAVLVNVPWLIRNYETWGEWTTRTNFGMTLYASNNDCAESSLDQEMRSGCYQATHPEDSVSEALALKTMGEPAYDRLKTAQALAWIRANPSRFFHLTLARILDFWFPLATPRYSGYAIWAITILSVPGLVQMFRKRSPVAGFVAVVWLIYPLMYYVVVSGVRYRVPILWISALSAGYFIASVVPPFKGGWHRRGNARGGHTGARETSGAPGFGR
ncbi:MAG TPA: hypothetical protein VGR73_03200 [Bryobacteraceae bacterium]|nr:hypothetical protein [Bryobacteraceae bacterium]